MEISKSLRDRMAAARQSEQDGQLTEASAIYQQLFDADPRNQEVLGRLLVIYRKQKEYRKELKVIDAAIAAFELRDKAFQDKWLKAHPQAASAGRSILRQLERGGDKASDFGVDPVVNRLRKRRTLVDNRITGKKKKIKTGSGKPKVSPKPAEAPTIAAARQKADRQQQARERKLVAAARKEQAAALKAKAATRKAQAAERNAQVAAERKKKAETRRAAAEARLHPSLFIVTLHYLVPLEKIDALMHRHMAYLNKHYALGDFLVSGRQVPRTGGIIITRGKDRDAVEQLVNSDPFVKQKLASADIIEFKASQLSKRLDRWLSTGRSRLG